MKYRIHEVEEVISEMDLLEVEDEEEKLFMPDFAVTVIYEGDIEGKDSRNGDSVVNELGESTQVSFPANSLYYEQDGFVITLANWLNGRLPVEQIEQLQCEIVIPQKDVVANSNLIKGSEE